MKVVVGKQSTIQHIEGSDSRVAALLHRETLEELRLASEERELAAHGKAECADAATFLEEVPERFVFNAKARFVEEARVRLRLCLRLGCRGAGGPRGRSGAKGRCAQRGPRRPPRRAPGANGLPLCSDNAHRRPLI